MRVAAVPRRVFYGWYVAGAVAATAFIAWGVGFYQLGVFVHAFHDERGWSLGALSVGPTIFYLLVGSTNLVAGRVIDRYGPRMVLLSGSLILGAGLFGLGQVRALWQFYLAVAVLAIGFACTSTLVLGAMIGRWFQRRRASVMTLALSGAPLGALVMVPTSQFFLDRSTLATGSALLALIAVTIVLPLAALVMRDDPAAGGWERDGGVTAGPVGIATDETPWTARAAARTRAWQLLTCSFVAIMAGQVAFLVHQVSFLSPIVGTSRAAALVSLTGGSGLIGRFAAGWFADRFPKHVLLGGYCLVQGLAVLLAAATNQHLLLAVSAALVGFTMGNTVALQPVLMAEHFGMRSYGAVFGPASFLTQCGAAFGLTLVGVLADMTGGYTVPFAITGTLALLAAATAVASDYPTYHRARAVSSAE